MDTVLCQLLATMRPYCADTALQGYPSPVWDTIEETHASYAACLELLIPKVASGDAEVLLGTHNEV